MSKVLSWVHDRYFSVQACRLLVNLELFFILQNTNVVVLTRFFEWKSVIVGILFKSSNAINVPIGGYPYYFWNFLVTIWLLSLTTELQMRYVPFHHVVLLFPSVVHKVWNAFCSLQGAKNVRFKVHRSSWSIFKIRQLHLSGACLGMDLRTNAKRICLRKRLDYIFKIC